MNVGDVVLFAIDHPVASAAALSFVGGATFGFALGRRSAPRAASRAGQRIEPRF